MATFSAIIAAITAMLQFPDAMGRFIKLLKSTDQENHDAILKASEAEARNFEQTGRPKWD